MTDPLREDRRRSLIDKYGEGVVSEIEDALVAQPSPSEPDLVCNCQNGDGTSHAKYHAVGCPIRTGVPPSPSEPCLNCNGTGFNLLDGARRPCLWDHPSSPSEGPLDAIEALPRLRLSGELLDLVGHGGDEFAVDWDEYDEFVRLADVRAALGDSDA